MADREQKSAIRTGSEVKGYLEICRRGDSEPRREQLVESHLIVGRNPNAQIVLDHTTVSRSHAELLFDPFGRWWVHDLGSTNGTLVNGTPVQERVLSPGDIIDIGDFTLRLHITAAGARSRIDSGYPLAGMARGSDFEAPGDRDDDATMIAVMPKSAQSPQISVAHLSTVMALGRRLMAMEDATTRLRTLSEFAVSDNFPAESACTVRIREGAPPKIVNGPYFRTQSLHQRPPYFSRGVLTNLWETREPVLASTEPSAGAGIRRLSIAQVIRQLAVVACPLEIAEGRMDALYVEFPPKYGTVEWLTLVALASEAYQQAELAWQVRKHIDAHAFVERELDMARQIQQGLVPKTLRFDRLEVAIGFQPCRWVGGDYVDAVPMPDGRVLLAVADVCGKGLQASLVASSVHTMVRATVDAAGSVTDLMDRLNRHLCNYLPEHSFVTMVVIALDAASGDIECINAGHPPPLVVCPDGTWRHLQSEVNTALGMASGRMELERTRLAGGEVLALYTDGLTDLVGEDQEMLGVDRLCDGFSEIVAHNPNATVDDLRVALIRMLDNFRISQLSADDMAFLIARRPRLLPPSVRAKSGP